MRGRVVALHRVPAPRANPVPKDALVLRAGLGIEGDHHAREESAKQVLLVAIEDLRDVSAEIDYPVAPGTIRENVTVEGFEDLDSLLGRRVRLGETVLLEVTGPCAPCRRMDEIRPGLAARLQGRRGVLARVVEGGTLRVRDAVVVEDARAAGA